VRAGGGRGERGWRSGTTAEGRVFRRRPAQYLAVRVRLHVEAVARGAGDRALANILDPQHDAPLSLSLSPLRAHLGSASLDVNCKRMHWASGHHPRRRPHPVIHSEGVETDPTLACVRHFDPIAMG
jgi:hypothetical protein